MLAWSTDDGQATDAINPPALPMSRRARGSIGGLRAEPRGNTIAVFDPRQLPERNAWPLPGAAERRRYHTEQARLAEQQQQWFAAAFHLGRLLLDTPRTLG